MDQRALELAAMRLVSKKVGHVHPPQQKKGDLDKLKRALEEAKEERAKLLLKESHRQKDYRITTVGKVVQERIRLEKIEQSKLDYIKRARGTDAEQLPAEREAAKRSRIHGDQALKRARVLKLHERVTSFRLAGVSCFSVGGRPNDLGLRFDATWGGHYFDEKYYVILTGTHLQIHRHSLPYFIPVDDLAKAFLPLDPGQFCRRVSRFICAFAGRRVLAEQLAKDFSGRASVSYSASLDIITVAGRLKAKGEIPVHSVQLKFDNVLDLIPSKADVCFLRPDGEIVLQKVVLDKIPGEVASAQFFNYSLWIKSVLDKRFTGVTADDVISEGDEEDEENSEEGEESSDAE